MSRIAEIQEKLRTAEGDMRAAIDAGDKEKAIKLGGMVDAYRSEFEAEVAVVNAENERLLASAAAKAKAEPQTFAERLLGARDEFRGIAPGFQRTISNAATSLPVPSEVDYSLPDAVRPPIGFLDTLPKGIANGTQTYFKQPTFTNAADAWTTGTKPESAIAWEQATALAETIAHWIPIAKQTANRYDELDSSTRNHLLLGLELVKNAKALRGSNSNGIVGVVNQSGILTHTRRTSDPDINLRDELQTMRRKVRVASGFAPNYMALSPYAIEKIQQMKDNEGRYLFEDFEGAGDTLVGMRVVEDVNMTIPGTGSTAATESAIVYFNFGAEWDVLDNDEITVGLVDKQLIQNQYTLLAEGTYSLKVPVPAAFCYCADLGIAAE